MSRCFQNTFRTDSRLRSRVTAPHTPHGNSLWPTRRRVVGDSTSLNGSLLGSLRRQREAGQREVRLIWTPIERRSPDKVRKERFDLQRPPPKDVGTISVSLRRSHKRNGAGACFVRFRNPTHWTSVQSLPRPSRGPERGRGCKHKSTSVGLGRALSFVKATNPSKIIINV